MDKHRSRGHILQNSVMPRRRTGSIFGHDEVDFGQKLDNFSANVASQNRKRRNRLGRLTLTRLHGGVARRDNRAAVGREVMIHGRGSIRVVTRRRREFVEIQRGARAGRVRARGRRGEQRELRRVQRGGRGGENFDDGETGCACAAATRRLTEAAAADSELFAGSSSSYFR